MSETLPLSEQTVDPVDPTIQKTPVSTPVVTETNQTDTVAYSTHRKLLSEKKALAEKLSVLEAENQQRVNTELEKNGEYKTLLANANERLQAAETELSQQRENRRDAQKIDSFLNTLNAKLDRKYWMHIDTDSIAINPDTGEVDEMSVTKAVEKYKSSYPETLYPGGGLKVPQSAPAGSAPTKTFNEMTTDELGALMGSALAPKGR